MLISELSQKYQCHVQTRWQGLEIVTEQAVSDLAYIDRLRVPANQIQTADLLLAGHFDEAQKGAAVTGMMLCVNMREQEGNKPSAEGVQASDVFEIAGRMANAAARVASLKPVEMCVSSRRPISKDSVIVVCAFANLVTIGSGEEEETITRTELMLQEKGFSRLVNRKHVNDILKERKMAALCSSSQGGTSARMLSELVKADLLVMGQVAPWKRGLRLDVFLVHAASGAILTAQTGFLHKPSELAEITAQCTSILAETPVVMPRILPSTEQGRKREARLLLSRELYPEDMKDAYEISTAAFDSKLSSTEGAYTLVHDDGAFVYEIMKALSQKLSKFAGFGTEDGMLRIFAPRAACLVNSALESFNYSESTPDILVLRAETLSAAGRYEESLALAKRQLFEHPGVENKRVCLVSAFCEQKLGHTAEALEFMARGNIKETEYGLPAMIMADIQKKRSSREIQQARVVGPEAEYEKYRALFMTQSAKPSFDDLARYLELMRKVKGPKVALSSDDMSIKASVDWRGGTAPLWVKIRFVLHRAMCEAELGNKIEAARRCKDVIASIDWKNATFHYPPTDRMNNEATNLLAKIEAETGPVSELWKTARETKPLTGMYRIYLIPVGDNIETTVGNIHQVLTNYYGDSLRILPPLPLPANALPTNTYKYDWKIMFKGALKDLTVPDDALMVIFVTKYNVGRRVCSAGQLLEPWKDIFNPVLLSYSDCWFSEAPKAAWKGASMFATRIPHAVRYLYCKKEKGTYPNGDVTCANFPCIFNDNLASPISGSDLRFAMCPACQEEYKKADFDKIHNDLMDYLKKVGVKIVKAEK